MTEKQPYQFSVVIFPLKWMFNPTFYFGHARKAYAFAYA